MAGPIDFIERRYGVRVRTVGGLDERALVLERRGLVLVDETLTDDEWSALLSLLAEHGLRPSRDAGQLRPAGDAPLQ